MSDMLYRCLLENEKRSTIQKMPFFNVPGLGPITNILSSLLSNVEKNGWLLVARAVAI